MTTTPPREGYYILCLKTGAMGDSLLWWRPNNAGYTVALERAGVYTQADLDAHPRYYNNGETTLAVPVAEAEARTMRVVSSDHLRALVASLRGADTHARAGGE